MYSSLESGLELSINGDGTKFPLSMGNAVQSIRNLFLSLPEGSAIISGSSIIQAFWGATWKDSDLDIYATSAAAKHIRGWLMGEAGQVLVDVGGGSAESSRYEDITNTLRVEKYVTRPKNGELFVSGDDYGIRAYESLQFFSSESSNYRMDIDGVLIETHPRVPICYEPGLSNRPCKIDLVVLEDEEISDAIARFDLDICQNIWDGRSFTIKNPSDAFLGRANTTPVQRNLDLDAYISCAAERLVDIQSIIRTCLYGYGLERCENKHARNNWERTMECKTNESCLATMLYPNDAWRSEPFPTNDLIKMISDNRMFAPDLDADDHHDCYRRIIMAYMVNRLRFYFIKGVLDLAEINTPKGPFHFHNYLMIGMKRRLKYKGRGIKIMHADSTHQIPQQEHFLRFLPKFDPHPHSFDNHGRWRPCLDEECPMELMMDEVELTRHLHEEFLADGRLRGWAYADHADSERRADLFSRLEKHLLWPCAFCWGEREV
jgi:hypothetical protein